MGYVILVNRSGSHGDWHMRSGPADDLLRATACIHSLFSGCYIRVSASNRTQPFDPLLMQLSSVAYIIAAAFICAEKWHLCNRFPTKTILRLSLRIKLFFIAAEILLVVLGSVTMYQRMYQTAIVVEWMAALFFTFYLSSFAIDFLATPEEHEKDDGVQLLSQRWDEEIAISRPTKMYILRTKRDSLIR